MKANNLSTSSILIKLLACIILIGFLVIGYTLIVRPWYSKWGTTKDELTMIMPGDEIIVNPVWDYTQAITIHAPTAEIWQWLVQIGQGRGGFYSFELLENLIGCDIQNTDRIMPEFQHLTIGDSIKLHPEAPGIPVVLVDSAKAIIMGGSDESQLNASSWSFLIQGLDVSNSRLIARFRSSYSPTLGNILLQRIFVQPTSLFMQKRMMIGIKQRAEGTFRSSVSENIQAILWLLIFGLMIVILISISIRRDWIRLFLIGLLAGLMLLLFIAWQPPIWIGITMVILLLFGMVWAVRQH